MAGPLRGEGAGGHEIITSKYGHITLKFSVGILSGLLQYFPKNLAILVQKMVSGKKMSKSVSVYFMTKKTQKVPMAIKPGH